MKSRTAFENRLLPRRNPWPLTVATYNIHSAIGADGRFAPERVAGVLLEMDADIIALQEVPLGGSGCTDVLALLREVTGYHAVEGLTENTAARRYGNAVLSRYPVCAARTIDLSFGSREARGALDADIDCDGDLVRVVATHLGLHPAERRHQIGRLLQAFDTDDMAVILMGDINEWFVWGRALQRLVSHFEAAPAPRTFPSRWPLFALDRIWIRPRQRLLKVQAHASPLARMASDHLPLVASIDGWIAGAM
ncbi:MAG: endonuclease [Herbaspirillum sp.]|jgi:endonuclease/exonuclease/phosphatase family metal-dependent hydrolase|nr:endonuclease [Herbaspirillum sp.]